MLNMLPDAVVHNSQPNAVEHGDRDLVQSLALAFLRDGSLDKRTHQTNEAGPIVNSKGVDHIFANVELSGHQLLAVFMSPTVSITYPRAANQDCQNTC